MTPSDVALRDVEYAVRDGTAELIVDRPQVYNCVRHETLRDLETARTRAESDDDVGAILLRSRGTDAFSTGADLDVLAEYLQDPAAVERWLADWHRSVLGFARSELPVVGSVTGRALAGGLELVLACDVVIAHPEATFGDQHLNVDLVAGGGGTQLLPRIVGRRRAKYLVLTGETIDAGTARRWGLVNEVAEDPLAAAQELAGRITEHHPAALARAKRLIDEGLDAPLEAGLELERAVARDHLASDVAEAGIERFRNR